MVLQSKELEGLFVGVFSGGSWLDLAVYAGDGGVKEL